MEHRIAQVGLETFEPRPGILGLESQPLVSLREALKDIPLPDKDQLYGTAAVYSEGDGAEKEESMAVYLYTTQGEPKEHSLYCLLNSNLRDRDRSKLGPYLPFIKLLNEAITKRMSKVEQTLWRGVALDLYDLYFPKKGKEIIFWGYTSTTIDMETLEQFIPRTLPKRTLFSILTSSAADLSKESAFPEEKELLIAAGTVFNVVNAYRISDNLTIVELRQVKNLLGVSTFSSAAAPDEGLESPSKKAKVMLGSSVSSQGKPAGKAGDQHTPKAADAEGIYQEGLRYENGSGVSKDLARAGRCYESAAALGHADAQAAFGAFLSSGRGGYQKNDLDALRLCRLAADQGNARAQNRLGIYHDQGRAGLCKDGREAVKWYRKAADGGYANAQYNLGMCYEGGEGGLARDEREAARLYRLAADQGDADAQYKLGMYYRNGRGGLVKDAGESKRLLQLAADQGHAEASTALRSCCVS